MKKRSLTSAAILSLGLSVVISGCGMNHIAFERYPQESPLVIVSDGLCSFDARRFFKKLCDEEKVPYIGEDNISWEKNKEAIEKAHIQGRKIILAGYSAGCDQVRITSQWCEEKGIPVSIIFFDPSYLQGCNKPTIHKNVQGLVNCLSDRSIIDFFSVYGRGREISSSDLESKNTSYHNMPLRGSHIGIFDNNREAISKEIRTIIRNNYRRRK